MVKQPLDAVVPPDEDHQAADQPVVPDRVGSGVPEGIIASESSGSVGAVTRLDAIVYGLINARRASSAPNELGAASHDAATTAS